MFFMQLNVKKRNGSVEKINVDKINKSVERACEGLSDVSASEVVLDASIQLYEGVQTKEIDKALIASARSKIEKEPNYSNVAARLLLGCLYKEVFKKSITSTSFDEEYRQSFRSNISKLISINRLTDRLNYVYDINFLSSQLKPERDLQFEYIGIQTLVDRYLLKIDEILAESPQAFFMRVAMGLAINEKDPNYWAKKFYDEISQFNYMPSTPTLFNSATVHNQLSSCFLSTMGDSEDGIMGCIHDQARLSKYAGGLGVDVSSVRASGAKIRGTDGRSSGPIPFLKILNNTVLAFDQGGGKRKGSCAVYMEPWHLDYEEFLDLRKNTGDERLRCHDLHTASWIPDIFMEKVEKDEDWYMFCSGEFPQLHELYGEKFNNEYYNAVELAKQGKCRHKIVKAKELMRKMLKSVFETGHPWFTFKDAGNRCYMQQEYIVHNTQLCTEIFRHTIPTKYLRGQKLEIGETAVCNLSSINLKNHLDSNGNIDWLKLENTVRTATRSLDNVIDENFYPIPEAEKSNKLHRPIGLGIMGFQDVLHAKNLSYESKEAVSLSEKIQQYIYYFSLLTSCELAKEKGKFATFDTSEWAKGLMHHDIFSRNINIDNYSDYIIDVKIEHLRKLIKDNGLRNANIQAIAPTATISYICGCSQSIEPDYSLLFVYSTLSGQFTMVNRWFVEKMKKLGKWNKEMLVSLKQNNGNIKFLDIDVSIKKEFATAFDVDYKALVNCASARQKWIDMGQSFNLYCDTPSLKKLYEMYMYCWKAGLKSTYYLRTLGASKTEKTTVDGNILNTKQVTECSIEAMKRGEVCESCS